MVRPPAQVGMMRLVIPNAFHLLDAKVARRFRWLDCIANKKSQILQRLLSVGFLYSLKILVISSASLKINFIYRLVLLDGQL